MNYYLIKNKFEKLEYNYNDKFNIEIYYLNNSNCQINVQRLDSNDGWGLTLQIKIFDIDDSQKFDIITFGNSNENMKTLYFETNIKLEYDKCIKVKIPSLIVPRNDFILTNKYNLVYNNKNIDFHSVLYYLDEYKMKIIIRRLDSEDGWEDDLKIILYDINTKSIKEIINIGKSELNYKILIKNTKIELKYRDNNYAQNIPKIIFQTGHSRNFKNILHFNSIISFIELNPEYKYVYYDDTDSRKFLREHFSDEINYSYDLLVPGAFKADLLRYCFLYHYGGCYFDCKQILRISIRDILDSNCNILLCNDVIENALLNAIIFSTEKNNIIEKTIKDCVYNIINKLGTNALDITGPIFFYKSIKKYISEDNLLLQNNRPHENFHDFNNDYFNNNVTIIKNNKVFLNRFYKGYYDNYLDTSHYGKLYNNNEIYYKNFQKADNYKICIYPNNYNDKFIFKITNNKLIIKRSDSTDGWFFNLKVLIINNLFKEFLIEVGESKNNIKEIDISYTF
jgi:mannosyltransferase OCH1-like enzyme